MKKQQLSFKLRVLLLLYIREQKAGFSLELFLSLTKFRNEHENYYIYYVTCIPHSEGKILIGLSKFDISLNRLSILLQP